MPVDLRPKVASYLRGGSVVIALMEYTRDVLGGSFTVPGGSGVLTDGTYFWRRDAADYIEAYGIALDDVFVEHMEQAGWMVPELPHERFLEIDAYLYSLLSGR